MEDIKLTSSSFPPGYSPNHHSSVHKLLQSNFQIIEIKIRPFQKEDIDEVVLLNRQWFPLQYGVSFYEKIANFKVQCKIAEAQIIQDEAKIKIIVGVLVYEYQKAGSPLKIQKWSQYIYWKYLSIYIMTIGVIDQFRNKGVGKKFLQILIQEASQNSNIKYIHLHMVSYNTASTFYQKNGFQVLDILFQHYDNIKGRQENAKYYVRFFNGGQRRIGWQQWIREICSSSH